MGDPAHMKQLQEKLKAALADWYAHLKAHPSFGTAGVWDANRYADVLPMVAQKSGPWLAAILLAVAGLSGLLWRVI